MKITQRELQQIIREAIVQHFDGATGKPLTVKGIRQKVHNILGAVDMRKLDDYEARLLNTLFNELSTAGVGDDFMKRVLFVMQHSYGEREFKDEVGSRVSDLPFTDAGLAAAARRRGIKEM